MRNETKYIDDIQRLSNEFQLLRRKEKPDRILRREICGADVIHNLHDDMRLGVGKFVFEFYICVYTEIPCGRFFQV